MRIDTVIENKRRLAELHKRLSECRLCREYFGHEPNPIIMGSHTAKIMQISQAPSKSVHLSGRPFDDASGRRLRGEWYRIDDAVFYDPDNFYIASIAHCYPGKALGGGDRLPPSVCAQKWLFEELKLVDNKLFVIIGGTAAKAFFPGEKITDLVYENRQINGKPAIILPHPSPLNVKWFMDNKRFESCRIPEIRDIVHFFLKLLP